MEAKELRIGNLVYGVSDRIETVVGLGNNTISAYPGKLVDAQMFFTEDDFTPIPLTEEWLVKFGFEPYENIGNRRFYHIENFIVESSIPAAPVYYTCGRELICFIEYVHQLQNLYFALTGEELGLQST